MGVIVVSVPYTGTRFLRERFGTKLSVHTFTPWDRLLEIIQGHKVVVPLRRPEDNWQSWARRWRQDEPIDHQIGEFNRSWYKLGMLDQVMELDLIPVDLQEDSRIQNWDPVGKEDSGDNKHPYDVSHLYELRFIKKYYGKE